MTLNKIKQGSVRGKPLINFKETVKKYIKSNFSHTNLIPGNYRNYDLDDNSRNLPGWTNLLLLGEGYHHNHHAHPWNYDNAEHPGEWDLSAAIIRRFFDIHQGRLGSEYKRKGI